MPDHSYEELRGITLDILAKREAVRYEPSQYQHLVTGVAEVLQRRGEQVQVSFMLGGQIVLSPADRQLMLEVFWNLFREGLISLGLNDANREFPFFHLSRAGKQLVESNQTPYFFHDTSTYETAIRAAVPTIDPTTVLYLKEAMQAFHSGCILSCTVMIGVATEHTFLLVAETATSSPTHSTAFTKVNKDWMILSKVNAFKKALDGIKALPREVQEDLETNFAAILSVIRNFRNQAGHPTGTIISREQAYVLLQLFIPYAKKLYQLKEWLAR